MSNGVAPRRSNVHQLVTKPEMPRRKKHRRMHAYMPGHTADTQPAPTARPESVPSPAARPMPLPTSAPLTSAFDDDEVGRTPSISPPIWTPGMQGVETEEQYLNGLGAESGNFFTDLFTTAADVYKQKQIAKTAQAQTAASQAQAAQTAALRGSFPGSTSLMGLSMTTWIMLAGAGVGAYLLLAKKRR